MSRFFILPIYPIYQVFRVFDEPLDRRLIDEHQISYEYTTVFIRVTPTSQYVAIVANVYSNYLVHKCDRAYHICYEFIIPPIIMRVWHGKLTLFIFWDDCMYYLVFLSVGTCTTCYACDFLFLSAISYYSGTILH